MNQPSLIPAERWEPAIHDVDLKLLPKDADLDGPEPSRDFLQSVERHGVLFPIIVVESQPPNVRITKTGVKRCPYRLADGVNRVKAARKVGMQSIAAMVYPATWTLAEVLTIVANEMRRPNPVGELAAIERLLGMGYSEAQIIEATGIPTGRLRKRRRLLGLAEPLMEGFKRGRMTAEVAERAAGMRAERQQRLAGILAEKKTLTAQDLKEELAAGQVKAMQSIADIFETPQAADKPDTDWKRSVLTLVEQALRIVPEDSEDGKHVQSWLLDVMSRMRRTTAEEPVEPKAKARKVVREKVRQ